MLKRVVSLLLAVMLFSGVALAANFTDLSDSHWAYQYVDGLVASGVINGYEDGTFRPEANVTRAELAKLVTVQFGENGEKAYSDVSATDWFYDYVTAGGNYFLSEGEFRPNTQATREEVAYAIYVATGSKASDNNVTFTDADDISAEYKNAIAAVFANGVITGYPDGSFLPKNNITRAETATVLSRAIALSEVAKPESSEVYQEVLKMAKLLEGNFDADKTITYGELSAAALRMYNNEWTLAYYNLGDVVDKKPFEHTYALAFWLIGRDVLGADIVTPAKIDTPISVGEAIDVMVYYSQLHDIEKRTINTSKLLSDVDKNALLTQEVFAQLATEIDNQIPILLKVVVNGGKTADKIPTEIRKDIDSYPAARAKYQVILEEVPNSIYDASYALSGSSLTESYDF
ncbi:MAG: S-layer homology domain-containing protein, partial [Clostridia bacterium]|nr:S-layer homology domain-containing protein [Clostridia bacterium]